MTRIDHTTTDLLTRLREQRPLVQCLTNTVVSTFTANVLLAVGASPAMTDVPQEAGPFAQIADGMLINLGTPAPSQQLAMREAVAARSAAGLGWVLDPVAIGALRLRTDLAHDLTAYGPTVVRGNASEVLALARAGDGGRGTDSTVEADQAVPAAQRLAATTGGAVAVSGAVDELVDADRRVRSATGTPLLTQITGGGCALGAVLAAFLAVADEPLDAAVAGTACYTVAAQQAAQDAAGPGSFAVALLDRLAGLEPATLGEHLRLSEAEPAR